MIPDPLPPELRDVEEALARRPRPEPSAVLRARVLAATGGVRPVPRRWAWTWKAAAAACLALNLAMTAANAARYRRLAEAPPGDGPLARRAAAIDADDRFRTLTARALANWAPAPDAGPLGRDVFSHEERREWDTP